MKKRFLRIYPPLLFSVTPCLAFSLVLHTIGLNHYSGEGTNVVRTDFLYLDQFSGVWRALVTFAFRGGLTGDSNGPLWSLALEMQAYVFAGLVAQIIVARFIWVKLAALFGLAIALRLRGLAGLEFYHYLCFAVFGLGILLSFFPVRFPRMLGVVRLDFSYSLYILHFPIMLMFFFVACQGVSPSLWEIVGLVIISLSCAIGVSIFSGLVFEKREWVRRFVNLPKPVGT